MKKFLISIGLVGLATVAAGVWTNVSARVLGPADQNCTSTAVVKCGVFNQNDLNSRIAANGRALYKNKGVSTSLAGAKTGIVRANGNIEVDGKVVATGAQVYGASASGGGTQFKVDGYTFRKHSSRESLRGDDAEAFVFFNSNGTFKNAIIKICGNPTEGTPVPVPSAQCDALDTPVITDRTKVALKARASTKNGAKISKYTFTIVDSNGKAVATKAVSTTAGSASANMTVEAAGTYTAKVVVTTSVGDKKGSACEKKFTIKEVEKPKTPSIKIEKTVSKEKVEVGQEFDYTVKVTNNGQVDLKDAVVTDKQPTGVTFVSSSEGKTDNGTWTTTIASLKVGESKTFTIKAKVTKYIEGRIKNTACVDTPTVPGSPDDCDDADVEVPPKPTPEYRCDLLEVNRFDANGVAFNVKWSQSEGVTKKSHVVRVYDAQGKEVYNTIDNKFSQLTAGKYTIKAFVTFTVDGQDKEVTSVACTAERTIDEPEQPKVPSIKIEKLVNGAEHAPVELDKEFDYTVKVTNNGQVDLKDAVVTDKQPTGVTFVSSSEGKTDNGTWTTTIASLKVGESKTFTIKAKVTKYIEGRIKNTACVDTPTIPGDNDGCDDATVEVPPTPEPGKETVCELNTNKIITINEGDFDSSKHSKNLDDCKEAPEVPETPTPTPEAPTELPKTGTGSTVVGGLGLGALVTATIAYVASRRNIIG